MMADYPGYDGRKQATPTTKVSGAGGGTGDPTLEPGQYPPGSDHGIFGGPIPAGTGAPGTAGASGMPDDPTNEPGQTQDGLTGISEHDITNTGAPGTQGSSPDPGGSSSVTFTKAGSYLSGTYDPETVGYTTDGPADGTQANDDGYASGGPQLPGIKGNEPQAGSGRYQPGGGRVLRGGRAVRG
jgi:hypothetical protein